jgi:hypothetical protein
MGRQLPTADSQSDLEPYTLKPGTRKRRPDQNPEDECWITGQQVRAPAGILTTLLASVGLAPQQVAGDGNCLIYSILRSAGRTASWEEAIRIRTAAIALAEALPESVKQDLRLSRPHTYPHDPMGKHLDHSKKENYWPISAQAKYGHPNFAPNEAAWMNDNMLHCIATVMNIDVAVLKLSRDDGGVGDIIEIYHAYTPYHPRAGHTAWNHRQTTGGRTRQNKTLGELLTESSNGQGRKICVITINATKTHFEATRELQ